MIFSSCHCGAVRISVPRKPDYLNECHCSICRRYAVRWGYFRPDEVRVEGETAVYEWGSRSIAFHRCPTCGCVTHWSDNDPEPEKWGVNARLFEPADAEGIEVRVSQGPEDD